MPTTDFSAAVVSDMTTNVPDIEVNTRTTDAATGQKESEWQCKDWPKYLGYYKEIPECKIATDTLARFTIGDGFIADPYTTVILDHVIGWGHDTFDDILENQDRVASIAGDSFAEVIRQDDEPDGMLLNLKPLAPDTIKTICSPKGIILRYEQTSKLDNKKVLRTYEPWQIFHLTNDRIADEIHGISHYEAITKIIDALNESFVDFKTVVHRNVVPVRIIEVDFDDPVKVAKIRTDYENAIKNKEVIIIPKGSVAIQDAGLAGNATFNPLPWREHIRNYFYQVVGIPQILMGNAAEFSESSAKIAFIAFEQVLKKRQRYIITQVWNQLHLNMDLDIPVSIRNEMISDTSKDGSQQETNFQPAEAGAM